MSTQLKRFRARHIEIDALQVVLGVTTKAAILAVCPSEDVGVPTNGADLENTASTDLRWATVPGISGPLEVHDGDWIAHTPHETRVLTSPEIATWFEPINGRTAA